MTKRTDIFLSVSAITAALSALEQVAVESPDRVIAIQDCTSDFQDSIEAVLGNSGVQCELRKRMGVLLPKMKVEAQDLENTWVRLALSQELIRGQANDGGPNAQGRGAGGLYGPHADSTFRDEMGVSGLTTCYTNCHSACHGSRGWR